MTTLDLTIPATWTLIARQRAGHWFAVAGAPLTYGDAKRARDRGELQMQERMRDGELVAEVRRAR